MDTDYNKNIEVFDFNNEGDDEDGDDSLAIGAQLQHSRKIRSRNDQLFARGTRFNRYGHIQDWRQGVYSDSPGSTPRIQRVPLTPHSPRLPLNKAQVSDETIVEDIYKILTLQGEIDARDIDIIVKNGIVTLFGVVHNQVEKQLAKNIIQKIEGVQDVRNELKVPSF